MKRNQMKFVNNNGAMKFLDFQVIDFKELSPIGYNPFTNNEIAVALDKGNNIPMKELLNNKNFLTIDVKELKIHFKKVWKQWFPFGQKNTTLAVGILWTAFVTYVFPWLLDVAKVYCAFMIAQGFYKEHKGVDGKGGRNGFQSFIYYGKWLIIFHMIPVGVELLDQIGAKMMIDIKSDPMNTQ